MLSTVWRVSVAPGTPPEIFDRFLSRLPGTPDAIRLEGAPDRRGQAHMSSGFNFTVSDGPEMSDITEDILGFLEDLRPIMAAMSSELTVVASELDLGLDVGGPVHFTRTARFSPEVLRSLAALEITLAVSGYPVPPE